MGIRDLVDLAIDEDPRSKCLWVPAEHWDAFGQAIRQRPNLIGVLIYRHRTVRQGLPYSDVVTR